MSNSKKVFSHQYRDNRLHTGQIREPNSHQLWHDEPQKCSQIFPLTVGSCVLIGKLGQDLVENSCRGRVFWVSCWHTCCDLYKKSVGSERTWYSTKILNIFQIQQQMTEIWTIFPDGSRFFWSLAGRVPEPKRVALGSCSLDGTWPRCIAICISKARFVSQLGWELRLTKVFRFYLWVTVQRL